MFLWPSPSVILREDDWKMQRSRARENYRKTFRKTRQSFRGAGKQSTDIIFSRHSPLIILWEIAWKMQRSRAGVNYRITFRKTNYILAFSWSRKTIHKYRVFMAFTVSNSVGKHMENAAFGCTAKLQKNFQENR